MLSKFDMKNSKHIKEYYFMEYYIMMWILSIEDIHDCDKPVRSMQHATLNSMGHICAPCGIPAYRSL